MGRRRDRPGPGVAGACLLPRAGRSVSVAGGDRRLHSVAASSTDTDWTTIVGLYDLLLRQVPSPVVALNRAVAVAMADGPETGLLLMDELERSGELDGYRYLPAARADLLRRLGRVDEARLEYDRALALGGNAPETAFLAARRDSLGA